MIRDLAFQLLNKGIDVPTREIDKVAKARNMDPRDRALLHEIISGVARRMGTLDSVLLVYLRRNPEKAVRTILRIGVYELIYLERTPPHAIVSESVAVAGRRISGPTAGFVNAVLRAVANEVTFEPLQTYRPSRDRFPAETRVARFARTVLPDPMTNPTGYLAAIHSLPPFLVERWRARFGDRGAADAFRASNERPPMMLRVNPDVMSREALIEAFLAKSFPAVPGEHPLSIRLPSRADGLFDSEEFKKGAFVLQDETQMRVADLLAPKPKEKILDMCSAPGGKTTHLAQIAHDKADIVAIDRSDDRVKRVRENLERLQLKSVKAFAMDATLGPIPGAPFDAVLVDAPCSNTGVLARRPEARWRVDSISLMKQQQQQIRLLTAGMLAVKPGGRVVYSTCSVEPEENESVIKQICETQGLATLVSQENIAPAPGREGGFFALMTRNS
ncbi:MAG: methyltransferase domain-containing protein [Planctomycetes bacterium]|nr:methyltransferase domain-containing protein [Planctomycetota bacterium]